MTRTLLTGNGAAAWGARLARVDYVPAFPITPQTEIIEAIGRWIEAGEMDARLVTLDSEHSMITAAGAAAATGVRVFSATSSQGLLYGMEMLYTVAGWRAPFVLVNVSRGLSAPITLEPDHQDVLAAREEDGMELTENQLEGIRFANGMRRYLDTPENEPPEPGPHRQGFRFAKRIVTRLEEEPAGTTFEPEPSSTEGMRLSPEEHHPGRAEERAERRRIDGS